jgi:ubiquinone/menaquinone biosynthesis C-methylase UbiE
MNSPREQTARLNAQYGLPHLAERVLAELDLAGKDIDALTRQDLATFEEFHLRSRKATRELAQLAELRHGMRVLDVGSGLAGPARTLADEFGCLVTGIDISWEYCRAAQMLNARLGFSHRMMIGCAQALALPLAAGVFDAVWMQHVSMNIEDKKSMIDELGRVLIPGGRFAFYEILAGSRQQAYFPLPWADDPEISFLIEPEPFRRLLDSRGFSVLRWDDVTASTIEWGRRALIHSSDHPPPLGLKLVVGADVGLKTANLLRNLEEDRARLVQAVLIRRS